MKIAVLGCGTVGSGVVDIIDEHGFWDVDLNKYVYLTDENSLEYVGHRFNKQFVDENGNEVTRDAYDYIDYAMGYDKTKRFPLFVKPSRKLSVKDVADAMRDHYEGTPMDMTTDIGAGGNALPYRWRPMGFEVDGKEYVNERAIATQQT